MYLSSVHDKISRITHKQKIGPGIYIKIFIYWRGYVYIKLQISFSQSEQFSLFFTILQVSTTNLNWVNSPVYNKNLLNKYTVDPR